jgi:hypothetical protein
MQTLIFMLFAHSVFASEIPAVLGVVRVHHHGKEITQIFAKDSGWYCATEQNKHFVLAKRPASFDLIPTTHSSGFCDEKLSVVYRGKKNIKWNGCREDAKEFYETLARECGRN